MPVQLPTLTLYILRLPKGLSYHIFVDQKGKVYAHFAAQFWAIPTLLEIEELLEEG